MLAILTRTCLWVNTFQISWPSHSMFPRVRSNYLRSNFLAKLDKVPRSGNRTNGLAPKIAKNRLTLSLSNYLPINSLHLSAGSRPKISYFSLGEDRPFKMRSSVISSKNSPRLLKKAKNFVLKNWVQRWEAGLVVHLVNTARASFLVSSEEKCLVVSIPRLSRAISPRTGGWDPLVLTAFFFSEPLSSLPSDLLPKRKAKAGLMG
jgi:hypothetical protein